KRRPEKPDRTGPPRRPSSLADVRCGGAMPKSKRGGTRKGAGRRRILTDIQRLQVGAAIQHLLVADVNVRHRAKVDDELGTYLANPLATWEKTWNRPLPETAEDEALRNRHSNDAGIEAVIMRRRRRRYRDKVKPSAIETLRKEIREEFEALDGRYFNAPTKAA